MAGTEVVQMNTRIGADIKHAGDIAFARAGYTPSQVVRRIWQLAAEHSNEPEVIRSMLEDGRGVAEELGSEVTGEKPLSMKQRAAAVAKGRTIVEAGMRKLGLSDEAIAEFKEKGSGSPRDYKELLEEDLWERYMEKNGA